MKARITELFFRHGIDLSERQAEQFTAYADLLLQENKKYNLTAITAPDEIIVKHFIDSALGGKYLPNGALLVDVGSGAGFPALPLKILNPTLRFTLLDAVGKRVNFLKTAVAALQLSEVECLHLRAEEEAERRRERYDGAVARAVSNLPTLLEYTLPLVKKGGFFLAYKGENGTEEVKAAENALKLLKGRAEIVSEFTLEGAGRRSFIFIRKTESTPIQYPRKQNKAKNFPL